MQQCFDLKNRESEWVFIEGMDCHISPPSADIISHMVQELVSITFLSVAQNRLNTKLLHSLSAERKN